MLYSKLHRYYQPARRQAVHKAATFFMFGILCAESLFSLFDAFYYSHELAFTLHFDIFGLLCTLVYFSVSLLICFRVPYKYLLIPDSVLLVLKLTIALRSLFSLLQSTAPLSDREYLSLLETATEGLLFSLFLAVLIGSKLIFGGSKASERLPFICLGILALCFPFTAGFEIMKAAAEMSLTDNTTALVLFNFFKGIANEIFLDLPYALLVIMMFFIPERGLSSKKYRFKEKHI